MSADKESFVSRWSKRKQEVAKETASEDTLIVLEDPVLDEETLAEKRLEKLNALNDEDMPDIETLNEDSDFSGFMSTGVSEALRKMALQKLFHGKSFNVRDGLDEYDGDYTSFEKLDASVITCDMKHILEVEAEKLLAEKKKEEAEEGLVQADENKVNKEVIEGDLDNIADADLNDKPDAHTTKSVTSSIKKNKSETGEEMILIESLEEGLADISKNGDVA